LGHRLGKLPYDLYGKTVLIVGFGRIGTRTAKRCLAMEMNVLVYDPYKSAAEVKAAECGQVSDLDAALPRADFVSIHCPKTSETVGMFNAARLRRMKPHGLFESTPHAAELSTSRRCMTRWSRASSPVRASKFSSRSRRRPVIRCLSFRTSSWHRTFAALPGKQVDRMSEQTARNLLSALDGQPIRQNVINQDVLG
jgi:D-3-phosphoglycerate dehydrogenase